MNKNVVKFVFAAKTIGGAIFSITIPSFSYDEAFKRAKELAEGCNVYPKTNLKGWERA